MNRQALELGFEEGIKSSLSTLDKQASLKAFTSRLGRSVASGMSDAGKVVKHNYGYGKAKIKSSASAAVSSITNSKLGKSVSSAATNTSKNVGNFTRQVRTGLSRGGVTSGSQLSGMLKKTKGSSGLAGRQIGGTIRNVGTKAAKGAGYTAAGLGTVAIGSLMTGSNKDNQ